VLRLYRSILKVGHTWIKPEERQYIKDEARSLFRMNKSLTSDEEIQRKIFEAESRLALAVHYKIPFPRLYNVAPGTTLKVRRTVAPKIKPAYMDTIYDETEPANNARTPGSSYSTTNGAR